MIGEVALQDRPNKTLRKSEKSMNEREADRSGKSLTVYKNILEYMSSEKSADRGAAS